jgi:hypothetical protein
VPEKRGNRMRLKLVLLTAASILMASALFI